MKFKGTIIGEASGSLASLTFAHNRGGQYIRQRVVPVNSNTPQQQAVRNFFSQLSTGWFNILTQTQRDQWNAYAAAVLIADALGTPRQLTGLSMYIKCNSIRLQAGKTRIDTGPSILTLASLTAPSAIPDASSTNAAIAFTNTDTWAGATGGHLFVYASRGQNASINYFKGPYRLAGSIDGAVVPPTSPATLALPFAVTLGQRVFFRFVCSNADARPSPEVRVFGIVVA